MNPKRLFLVVVLLLVGYQAGWYVYQRSRFQRLEFSAFIAAVETTPQSFKPGTLELRAMSEGRTAIQGERQQDGRPFYTSGILDERVREKIVASGLMKDDP